MNRKDAKALIEFIKSLADGHEADVVTTHPDGSRVVRPKSLSEPEKGQPLPLVVDGNGHLPMGRGISDQQFEGLYERIKGRLIDDARIDPILLQLLTQRPEIQIDIEPRVEVIAGNTLRGRTARLLSSGWFDGPRTTGATRKELARTGPDPGGGGGLSDTLSGFVRDGFLTREGEGYQRAPGVRVSEREIAAR